MLTQKSTCLDSLLLDRQRKSSKKTDHIMWRREEPIFHSARDTLRKAVMEATEPNGRTRCLKILRHQRSQHLATSPSELRGPLLMGENLGSLGVPLL